MSRLKVIDLPRGRGKTTALLKYMAEPENEDVHYLAPTYDQAYAAGNMYADLTEEDPRDVRARFHKVGALLPPGTRVVLDEADAVIAGGYGVQVEAIALTSDKHDQGVKVTVDVTPALQSLSRLAAHVPEERVSLSDEEIEKIAEKVKQKILPFLPAKAYGDPPQWAPPPTSPRPWWERPNVVWGGVSG